MFSQFKSPSSYNIALFLMLIVVDVPFVVAEQATRHEPKPFLDIAPWGRLLSLDSKLILQVDRAPVDGTVSIPRLNNPVKAVYFDNMPNQQLELKPGVREWNIHWPEIRPAKAGDAIVIQLEGKPFLPKQPRMIRPNANGQIQLAAHNAVTHGEALRYEPQPHKNTLGYWTRDKDWAEWHFTINGGNAYAVEVRYGCGTGHGGSVVRLECAQQNLQWQVAETGGFQTWREFRPGKLQLNTPGKYTMVLRAVHLQHKAVMDVQQIVLTPEK